ncbi:hypothetical protein EVAR_72155_1 [Eumeta japonica]|uniref:Uncharacterized protein n=1 Tax=Eumeta variegata TaxID=151549 RepID=A0A4C1SMH4_EUMVA|nr:hypothetical protein EVAR_72155_1 [Eumeta japonica]
MLSPDTLNHQEESTSSVDDDAHDIEHDGGVTVLGVVEEDDHHETIVEEDVTDHEMGDMHDGKDFKDMVMDSQDGGIPRKEEIVGATEEVEGEEVHDGVANVLTALGHLCKRQVGKWLK